RPVEAVRRHATGAGEGEAVAGAGDPADDRVEPDLDRVGITHCVVVDDETAVGLVADEPHPAGAHAGNVGAAVDAAVLDVRERWGPDVVPLHECIAAARTATAAFDREASVHRRSMHDNCKRVRRSESAADDVVAARAPGSFSVPQEQHAVRKDAYAAR